MLCAVSLECKCGVCMCKIRKYQMHKRGNADCAIQKCKTSKCRIRKYAMHEYRMCKCKRYKYEINQGENAKCGNVRVKLLSAKFVSLECT